MENYWSLVVRNYDFIFGVSILIPVTFLLWKTLREYKRSEQAGIPGRLGFPYIGETLSFISCTSSDKGCYNFVRMRRLWYGKLFKTRLYGYTHVYVSTVQGAKSIITNDFKKYTKEYIKSMEDAVGKKSLFRVPVESHKRIRRLLSDPFSIKALSKFVQIFDQMLSERLKKLEREGNSFAVLNFSMKLTFDAMCGMLMSVTNESLLVQIERDVTAVSNALLCVPLMIPGTRYYRGHKARKRLMKLFEGMIACRRGGVEVAEDVLESMLERDSCVANEKLDDLEIKDNLMTFLLTGQSTTAAAMMWVVKYLDENKDIQAKLREEQLAILKTKPLGYLLTYEDLNNMRYALLVVKETLRMANVVMWFPRVALDDCTIEGMEIKKGWRVNVDATCIHYDPEVYKDPMQFDPSRFEEIQKPYTYIPFGSGPRLCLGKHMAKVIMLVFLHRLTSGYNWSVDNLDTSLEWGSLIARLKTGCPITLTTLKAK